MRKKMITVVAFAFIAVALALPGSARAQTCCVCTECIENPPARCFADINDTLCADFCAAQECNTRELIAGACFAPLCPDFPPLPQAAPALGPVGLGLTSLAVGLAGMVRLRRRGKRPARS